MNTVRKLSTRILILQLLVLQLGFATQAAENVAEYEDYGPLHVRAQAPLQSNSVSMRIRSAFNTNHHEVFGSGSIASVWANNDDYTMDYYQNDLQVGGQYILDSETKIELSYLYRFAANNHLDSLSIEFHDALGIGQNGREDVDKHRFIIDAPAYLDEPVVDFDNETLNNAWEIYVEQNLYQSPSNQDETRHALSIGATLYYNYVGHGPFRDNSFEQSAQVNYSVKFDRYNSLYMLASLSHRDPDDTEFFRFKEWTYSFGAGYQYRMDKHHSILAEFHAYEGIARDLEDLKEDVFEFTLGYRYHFESSAIELAMVENFINADNSADIAFSLSYRHKL